MAVVCSSVTSWFPGMVLTYFLNDSEMVPVAPIITGIYYYYYINGAHIFQKPMSHNNIFSAGRLTCTQDPQILRTTVSNLAARAGFVYHLLFIIITVTIIKDVLSCLIHHLSFKKIRDVI
jgi:hypothetical protein